jgi:hypothetical protein
LVVADSKSITIRWARLIKASFSCLVLVLIVFLEFNLPNNPRERSSLITWSCEHPEKHLNKVAWFDWRIENLVLRFDPPHTGQGPRHPSEVERSPSD